MGSQQQTLSELSKVLPLDEDSLKQIITYTETLSDAEAAEHLRNLLGDSPQALDFITSFTTQRRAPANATSTQTNNGKADDKAILQGNGSNVSGEKNAASNGQPPAYDPPAYPPPSASTSKTSQPASDVKRSSGGTGNSGGHAPAFAPPAYPPPTASASNALRRPHTNKVIEAAHIRARDEQEMQTALQNLQFKYRIYNSEIEPEHEYDGYCNCPIHQYQRMKWSRYRVQEFWSQAVMYPGEKSYNDNAQSAGLYGVFSGNPYTGTVISPYGRFQSSWSSQRPRPDCHAASIHQTIDLNNRLNAEAQRKIDAKEPKINIWDDSGLSTMMSDMAIAGAGDKKQPMEKAPTEKPNAEKRQSISAAPSDGGAEKIPKKSKLASFRKSVGLKTSEEKALSNATKAVSSGIALRNEILAEENGRWPDEQWRQLVASYQEKVGMTQKIADLRVRHPIQYLHLLRAGYFEPIPVAWANLASNPLKFTIEAAAGWRGITPAWRGYEDTAEERLYWVLNHREGSVGMRMKPDFISEMNMARARMASAVEPPPEYFAANDTCHLQHTSAGYSKQVMPTPFVAYDRPEVPTDDTMILLDVSGSMDFDPVRPNYNQYLITGYSPSTQPKNQYVAKAIIRRFTDAMANHDHEFRGYDMVTFSNRATYIGTINHQNLDHMWRNVRLGGGTRVMTGWQKVKELHFQKHSASAIHHPIYGWQAGPETPMLRLLLLLDGEATDMDEFELDLLGLAWAHVTIFLIGVDGCPHHHRHANELQRISDVNHHVSFVDAQGNTPERFVTHELLKRHLGYQISMSEFEEMEELPSYSET
ncbi:uncharacterized protein BDZ99DRAFT_520457 [Mytilinidion resinicola]|uniref:VWFA domain-containing protein n=1 Tax=Mytilinidion resinicola TaxID=574789 RepID=A0A6A6YNC3_9PEZI|nr:uncharacterized protein BDZ99DRAFT_520457 [Mytilinidion resinicola]KAF2810386.1 hypothetical protein BDZ99DRAFT_520457 [Mytilinidion resinicola]